jgi:hypothetical protein
LSERPGFAPSGAGGLRAALDEHDRQLGLGQGGPVASAAREIGMSEIVTGSARFEIVLDPSGQIRSATLLDASGDTAGWQRFADELGRASMRATRIGEGANGAWMLLDVDATNEPSSGHRRWWAPGIALLFDAGDINARDTRVVHSRVSSQLSF